MVCAQCTRLVLLVRDPVETCLKHGSVGLELFKQFLAWPAERRHILRYENMVVDYPEGSLRQLSLLAFELTLTKLVSFIGIDPNTAPGLSERIVDYVFNVDAFTNASHDMYTKRFHQPSVDSRYPWPLTRQASKNETDTAKESVLKTFSHINNGIATSPAVTLVTFFGEAPLAWGLGPVGDLLKE